MFTAIFMALVGIPLSFLSGLVLLPLILPVMGILAVMNLLHIDATPMIETVVGWIGRMSESVMGWFSDPAAAAWFERMFDWFAGLLG